MEKLKRGERQQRIEKHKSVYERFYQLYEVDRIRIDDVFKMVAFEYFYSERTIANIVGKNAPKVKRYKRPTT
jgi:hypothetical protein